MQTLMPRPNADISRATACRAPRSVHELHALQRALPGRPTADTSRPCQPCRTPRRVQQARAPPCLSAPCRALLSAPSCAACQRHATARSMQTVCPHASASMSCSVSPLAIYFRLFNVFNLSLLCLLRIFQCL